MYTDNIILSLYGYFKKKSQDFQHYLLCYPLSMHWTRHRHEHNFECANARIKHQVCAGNAIDKGQGYLQSSNDGNRYHGFICCETMKFRYSP